MSDVFVSYSHCDLNVLANMKRHFAPISNRVRIWDDTQILAGQVWKDEILKALLDCKVAILLISADFFNSKFISDIELPFLLEKAQKNGALILSVIVKPCLFDEYPELNRYQALNPPSYSLIQMPEFEQELIWINLVKRVKTALNLL